MHDKRTPKDVCGEATKIADGSFSVVIQFGHCEKEELTHCNLLKL